MEMTDGTPRATRQRQRFIVAAAIAVAACRTPTPQLSFLDDESSLSFTHPPRWSVAFAEQGGLRYRYLTAPKVEGDKESLSITLIPSTASVSASALAQSYLSDASGVVEGKGPTDSTEWSFADSSGVASRLRIAPSEEGRFFGAWVRGPESAMSRYKSQVDTLLGSLRVERPAGWEEERFAGMVARAPRSFTRGSRLSSVKTASMQFRSPALAVEKGTATIHGFVTVSREQVPPPG